VDAFDEKGLPFHKRGISAERGIYFLGLPNLVNRASSFIYGVWHDAKYIADHIVLQNAYSDYVKSSYQGIAAVHQPCFATWFSDRIKGDTASVLTSRYLTGGELNAAL
jgi:hypothetical protein